MDFIQNEPLVRKGAFAFLHAGAVIDLAVQFNDHQVHVRQIGSAQEIQFGPLDVHHQNIMGEVFAQCLVLDGSDLNHLGFGFVILGKYP